MTDFNTQEIDRAHEEITDAYTDWRSTGIHTWTYSEHQETTWSGSLIAWGRRTACVAPPSLKKMIRSCAKKNKVPFVVAEKQCASYHLDAPDGHIYLVDVPRLKKLGLVHARLMLVDKVSPRRQMKSRANYKLTEDSFKAFCIWMKDTPETRKIFKLA